MDKVLTTALLTIAAIVAAVMVVNAILPAVSTGSTSVVSSSRAAADRMKTAIEIIHVAETSTSTKFWVKNVGSTDIPVDENVDVFLDDDPLEYNSDQSTCGPKEWYYEGDAWVPSETIEIVICFPNSGPGTIHFITANGKTAKKSF